MIIQSPLIPLFQRGRYKKEIKSSIHIEVGEPVHEILDLAKKERVDLIVVGRKKRVDIENIFIGSYTHKVITRARHMIFVSKYMVEYKFDNAALTKVNDRPFEIPLVSVGGSEELSQRVIDSLIMFKGAGGILDEILRVSRERKASMIVMGNTSEHRFLEDLLHRSLSYQVTKASELPVLLVP